MTKLADIERAVVADAGLAVQNVAVRNGKPGEVVIWIVLKPGCVKDARRIAEINAVHAARDHIAAGMTVRAECVDKLPEEAPRQTYPSAMVYGLGAFEHIKI